MFPGNKEQKRRYGTRRRCRAFLRVPGETGNRSVFAAKRDYRNNANRFSLPASRSRDVSGVTEITRERKRERGSDDGSGTVCTRTVVLILQRGVFLPVSSSSFSHDDTSRDRFSIYQKINDRLTVDPSRLTIPQ